MRMIEKGAELVRSKGRVAAAFSARTSRSRCSAILVFAFLAGQISPLTSACATDARIDSPCVLRDRALQNALRHSQQPEDIQKALNLYRAAIDRSEKEYGPDSSYTAQLYFEMGSYALDNSKFTVAVDSLNKAVQIDPNAITPRLSLVRLYELRKEPTAARLQLVQLLKKHPDSREGRQLLVNEIQNSDPAAATRQAFRIDKLVLASLNPVTTIATPAKSTAPTKRAAENATLPGATVATAAPPSANTPNLPTSEKAEPKVDLPSDLSPAMLLRMHIKPAAPKPPEEQTAQVLPVHPLKPPLAVVPPEIMAAAKKAEKAAHHESKGATKPKKSSMTASAKPDRIPPPPKSERTPHLAKVSGGRGGLVPPPPPLPFMPVFPGMTPPPPQGVPSVQLKTEAKIKSPPKKEAKKESDNAAASKSDSTGAPPEKASSSKPAAESDSDFLLDWGGAQKKKKKQPDK